MAEPDGRPHAVSLPSLSVCGLRRQPASEDDWVHIADWDPSRDVFFSIGEDLSPAGRVGMTPVYYRRAAAGSPTPAPTRQQVREGRWVNDQAEGEESTIWWEFGAGEAMEPEQALRNHADNQQFEAAYRALVALINGDL
jgi:hypothetical protein